MQEFLKIILKENIRTTGFTRKPKKPGSGEPDRWAKQKDTFIWAKKEMTSRPAQ